MSRAEDDPYAGMSAADVARCRASDTNLAGIVTGRLAAARALLARDPGPSLATREGWAPVVQALRGRNR